MFVAHPAQMLDASSLSLSSSLFGGNSDVRACARAYLPVRACVLQQGNGSARIVGQRKWVAKQRSEQYGGILFAPESVAAFKEQAAKYGVDLPAMEELEVAKSKVAVAGKL